jgi:LuxR family transcriptional regulator, quorum-sensing system regulator SdiA
MLQEPAENNFETELYRAVNRTDFFRIFKMLADRYGFLSFVVLQLPAFRPEIPLERACLFADLPRGRESLRAVDYNEGHALLEHLHNLHQPEILAEAPSCLASFMPCNRMLVIPFISEAGDRITVALADSTDQRPEEDVACAVFDFLGALQKLAFTEGIDTQTPRFSKREIEVVEWAAEGKTSAEIAVVLGLSEYTVNEYISSAMKKLDAQNRIHLVTKAIRIGIIA